MILEPINLQNWKKRDCEIFYSNNPKMIVFQYFGFSSIFRFEKARNFNFLCHQVILEPKNHQNWTIRDYEIFTQLTLKRSYFNILDILQFLGLKRLETTILYARK